MYKNRISRPNVDLHPQFFIRRSEIAFDERVAFVESVCATLIESRFGPGAIFEASPVIVNLRDRPELEPASLYDLFDDGMLPSYALSPQGRAGYQVIEAAYRRRKQMGLLNAGPNARNSTAALTPIYSANLGRGSP